MREHAARDRSAILLFCRKRARLEIGALVVAAVGTSPLLFLAFLACPLSMGLMMWFMGRGMRGKRNARRDEASLAEMRVLQARLAEKIDKLERASDRDPRHSSDSAQGERRAGTVG